MKIAIAGCINRDTVKRPGKPTLHGFGGILYNIFGLSRLLGNRAEIIPVCNLGHDVSRKVMRILSGAENVDTNHIRVVPYENNHCRMTYVTDTDRDEIFTGFVPSISFGQLSRIVDCDLALVNFISGHDMTLTALTKFRNAYDGIIYMDFHTLSLGLRKDGGRFSRRPKRWMEYVAQCDFLQMNRSEFNLLSGELPDRKSLVRFFERYLSKTARALIVTLDSSGAAMVTRDASKILFRQRKPTRTLRVTDTTGTGDLFSAGFCAGLATGRSLTSCLRLAVDTGTYGCCIVHPQDVKLAGLR
jgi:sugar/nucleoside kinase (ribokinase family)